MVNTLYFHHYNDYSGSTKVLADKISSCCDNPEAIAILVDNTKEGFLTGSGAKLINVPIIRFRGKAVPVISQVIWFITGFVKALYYGRKYDVFYINTIVPMYAALAGRVLHKDIIYHIHEKYVNKSVKSRLAESIFNTTKAKRIFVSKYVASKYVNDNMCENIIEYNKLSKDFLKNVDRIPCEEHNRNSVIMISSLQKGKGVDMFVQLASVLPDYSFTLILNCSYDEINRYFVDSIPDNLTILDKQNNIHPYLKKADVVLNLSNPFFLVETFGMTIIEGMAYGLPAIVPNAGGPVEVVQNNYNGFCVDVTDINVMKESLLFVLEKNNYERMYNNSLKRLELFI